jgi:acyl-coenzyme A synthetase/AMP-(fatty) acid ligase
VTGLRFRVSFSKRKEEAPAPVTINNLMVTMMMQLNRPASFGSSLTANGNLLTGVAVGDRAIERWSELRESAEYLSGDQIFRLRGRSVVIATIDQFVAAALLIQLDGIAGRIVLYPPDMPREHLTFVADTAQADAIFTDQREVESMDRRAEYIIRSGQQSVAKDIDCESQIETEWILLTSGTTGLPKLVVHTLASLSGAIDRSSPSPTRIVWSTFYDIRRYGGLQIFLRAALTGASLVLQGLQESATDFFGRAGAQGVTHISGTPSHWRRALMNSSIGLMTPTYIRLSGEIADQTILNQLRVQYPQAKIVHAFASTEAGVAFEVNDGFAGIPVDTIHHAHDVEMKVEGSTLRVRSSRTASRYLGKENQNLKDSDGFVDTGDVLDVRDNRYYFVGRRDGTINVGGLKVHPEEVEAVINRYPGVSISLVRTKKNPIIGALVIADVVLKAPPHSIEQNDQSLQRDILQFCRRELAQHKVPAVINFVPMLAMSETGKLIRPHA